MQMKPLVGVTADRTMMGPHPSHVAGEKYLAAVVDGAQALAMLLPALGDRQAPDDLFAHIDGLLFTGSYSNVEPHRYGGHASAPGTLHDAARDATTLPLMRRDRRRHPRARYLPWLSGNECRIRRDAASKRSNGGRL